MALALTSDLHVGSSLGLWAPNYVMNNGGVHQLSRWQEWNWGNWLTYVDTVPMGSVLGVIGDIVQGVNIKDPDLVSFLEVDQEGNAVEVLTPLIAKVSEVDFTYGTEWHDAAAGQSLLRVVLRLKDRFPGVKIHLPEQEVWRSFAGKRIHMAHHRGIARSPMTKGTPLAVSLAKMLASAPQREGLYPDIVVRAHAHDPGYLKCSMGISIGLPGWQLKTRLVWKQDPESVPVVGGMILDTVGGDIRCLEKTFHLAPPAIRLT